MTFKKDVISARKTLEALVMLFLILGFGLLLSARISEFIYDGFELAVKCVLPASLPFMIISDFYIAYGRPENISFIKRIFSVVLGIDHCGIAPFICGNIGGFPIGAKMCSECYLKGQLSREDAERLLPLSSNPSCAFLIGGVGLGIYGDTRIGVLLLISVYGATLLCAIITRRKTTKRDLISHNVNYSYDFISSVKNAAQSSVSIISFIAIFSAINGFIKMYVCSAPLVYLISALLEVTNAVKIYSDQAYVSPCFSLIMTAFSLGFGGLCVGLQSAVFTSAAGLKMRKYYLVKLLEGILSASIFSILYTI